jgi:hypothetical protein
MLLQARCEIDAIAEHVGFRDDHVAEMNGDPQHYRRWRTVLRTWRNESLHLARPFDRIEGAREADEHAVAGRFDHPPAVMLGPGRPSVDAREKRALEMENQSAFILRS